MQQLSLPLVAAETDRATAPSSVRAAAVHGVSRLERTLRAHLGPKVVVKLTDNRTTMISYKEQRGVLHLRLHTMFVNAPVGVLSAVAAFVSGLGYRAQDATLLDAWIEAHRPARAARPPRPARPIGEVHDLRRIFDELNARWFGGTIRARVTWGEARRQRGRRTTIQLGAYDEEAGEIRIHPALDQRWVPRFFVASVVFHEMLHEKHDAPVRNGRREVHSAAFLADERRYPDYERARAWEGAHLDRLLAY